MRRAGMASKRSIPDTVSSAKTPRFAQACEDAGFIFIGPSPRSIALMGSKTEARRVAKSGGAPVVPGTESGLTPLPKQPRSRATPVFPSC